MTLTLTTFVAGTKAKAEEVNANFSALQNAVNEKAAMDGDNTQTFSVADATGNSHAVNKGQLEDLSDDLTAEIKKTGTKFCVKSGNTTEGKGDLFSYDVYELNSKIGGTYDNLVIADYTGTQTIISTTPASLNLTGNANGNYNIFITPAGVLYILNNTIYRQAKRPTMVVGDIWLNTSTEPFECIKYTGANDDEFLDVPLGKVTFESAAITAVETFPFNQNGYNITSQTNLELGTNIASSIPNFVMPDYENGVSKSFSTVYKAASDGFLHINAKFNSTLYISSGNADSDSNYTWTTLTLSSFGDQGYTTSSFLPIPKNMYYKVTVGSTSGTSVTFFPCLAV